MLKRLSDVFYKALYGLSSFGFGALVVLLFVQILARNLLKYTFANVDEFTKFLFVWVMYLEISLAVRKERHIRIDFLIDKIKGPARYGLEVVNTVFTIIFFVVLAVCGTLYSTSTMAMISPILRWPMGAMYLCIPAGCFFSIVFAAEKLIGLFTHREEV